MVKPKELILPENNGYQNSGIKIKYIKTRDVLYISGWYDSIVGIEGTEISFKSFCQRLGIPISQTRHRLLRR